MKSVNTASLLLARGADPNASIVPVPVLFFAIKNADCETVRQLLLKGANPNFISGKSVCTFYVSVYYTCSCVLTPADECVGLAFV